MKTGNTDFYLLTIDKKLTISFGLRNVLVTSVILTGKDWNASERSPEQMRGLSLELDVLFLKLP